MKFRKITLRMSNNEMVSWDPLEIEKIEFCRECVVINNKIIERKDADYPHWDYFIKELTRTFEIEGFKIEL